LIPLFNEDGDGRTVVGTPRPTVCVPSSVFVEEFPSITLESAVELEVELVCFVDTPSSFIRFELSFLVPSFTPTSALRLIPPPLTAADEEVVEVTPFLLDGMDPRDGPPCKKRQLGRWHDSSGHGSAAKRPRLRNMVEMVTVSIAAQGSMVARGASLSLSSVPKNRVAVKLLCCEDES
jgi:hypothetical protein